MAQYEWLGGPALGLCLVASAIEVVKRNKNKYEQYNNIDGRVKIKADKKSGELLRREHIDSEIVNNSRMQ